MEEKQWMGGTCYTGERGEEVQVAYYLVTGQWIGEDDTAYLSYGVQVRSSCGDEVVVPHITTKKDKIKRLLGRLSSYGVTPVTVKAVVMDFLVEEDRCS